ncbi:SIS domain-containing protein [Kribbella deserti]|uniref:SIS domain-containing protein n=1 Tax=Kribbella deserti TaxID=1926257 RepID=A0ABV6QRC9_9ACTN
MSVEIAEQPDALAATFEHVLPLRDQITRLAAGRRNVLFVARGSSDNACVYGRYLTEIHAGRQASLAAPSVATLYGANLDLSNTLVVAVSQSGATQEIVDTAEWAKRNGAAIVGITNHADSPLASTADVALITQAGQELAVPATKTYTTQLAAITVAVDALASKPGTLDADIARVPEVAAKALELDVEVAAALLAGAHDVLASGRGLTFGTTLEVALKLEETCLQPVRGLSYADLKHGPIAVVDSDLVTILVAAPSGPALPGLIDLAGLVREKGSKILGIGGDAAFASGCDVALPGPDLPETLAPLTLIIPAQLTIEALARKLGLDPDAPRGLRKVTQTD